MCLQKVSDNFISMWFFSLSVHKTILTLVPCVCFFFPSSCIPHSFYSSLLWITPSHPNRTIIILLYLWFFLCLKTVVLPTHFAFLFSNSCLAFAPTILLKTLVSIKGPERDVIFGLYWVYSFFNSLSSWLIITDNDKCLCRIIIYEVDVVGKKLKTT